MPRPKGQVPKPSDGRCPTGYAVAMAKSGKLTCYKIPEGASAARALYARLLKLNESRVREQREKILGSLGSPKTRGRKSPKSKGSPRKSSPRKSSPRKSSPRKSSPKKKSPKVPRPSPTSLTCPTGYVVAADKNGKLKCYKVPTDPKVQKRFFQKLHKQNKDRIDRQLDKYGFTQKSLYERAKPGRKARSPSKKGSSTKKASPDKTKKISPKQVRKYKKVTFSPSGRPMVNWTSGNVPLAWRGKAQPKISITKLRQRLSKISMQNSLEDLKKLAMNARHYPGGGLRGGETKKQIYNRLISMRKQYIVKKEKKKASLSDGDGRLPTTRATLRTLKQQADAWFKAI